MKIEKMVFEKVDFAKHIDKFINVYSSDVNSRYLSYDHIRKAFLEHRENDDKKDYLALNLYSYLASWGMLRNSFLMQKDYKFLIPVVDILCKKKYETIIDYNPFCDEGNDKPKLIFEAGEEIKKYFLGQTFYEEKTHALMKIKNVSDTLLTKILLGTLSCIPAYDRYVKEGLSKHNIVQKFNAQSIREIRSFAKANKDDIMSYLSKLNELYTPMKIIDMYFFEEGFTG